VARSQLSDQAFRDQLFSGVQDYSGPSQACAPCGTHLRTASSTWPAATMTLTPTVIWRAPGPVRRSGDRHGQQPPFLPGHTSAPLPVIVEHLGRAGSVTPLPVDPHHHRKALRLRPVHGAPLERAGPCRIRRESGLPHRPLPWQGIGQNILTFRFANTIFEPLWSRNYIDHVQITVARTSRRASARAITTRWRPARHVQNLSSSSSP